ncbi:leucine-rich repeat receptor-like serine/threonine-protein kinase [Corchorus olitorius]|uniref:Leucine-rich repeat receptor-like serine/threonine-protein kinase n=1 Tax=Corchorus olitorius TaxID=93759 RepID=A0A1R3IR08_9ROSI|nr:leucine-rich repeat receptor-like serine/threonine-protein kinase [Corchorus olitorius]
MGDGVTTKVQKELAAIQHKYAELNAKVDSNLTQIRSEMQSNNSQLRSEIQSIMQQNFEKVSSDLKQFIAQCLQKPSPVGSKPLSLLSCRRHSSVAPEIAPRRLQRDVTPCKGRAGFLHLLGSLLTWEDKVQGTSELAMPTQLWGAD